MAGLRFTDLQSRPTEFLDFTSVTLDEVQQLVPPVEDAFQSRMAVWRMDGKPRTARRFTVYKNCPLPTPQDQLFFLLTYLKSYALQVVHGQTVPRPLYISGDFRRLYPVGRTAGLLRWQAPQSPDSDPRSKRPITFPNSLVRFW